MADRREPPKPGTPEYRWLYGDPDETRATDTGGGKKRPVPQSDETRVMPVVLPPQRPRQQRQAPSRPTAYRPPAPPASPPRRPVSPPPGTSPSGRPPQAYRKPRKVRRWIILALAAWLAFLVITPVLAMQKIEKVDAFPSGDRPADQPGTTYLVTGSDSRKGLTAKQRRRLHTGGDVGQRTDTIMILHIGSGPDLLMSIPRDSLVEVPGHGVTKINAAFAYGGPKLLTQTVEQNTGIRIDDYVEIGMGGVVKLVNAVGGITICPTQDMDDPLANLHVKKGCQHANGRKALAYARSRHTSGLGDIDRAKHQREVVGQVGHKAVSIWSVLNPVRYWKLTHAGASTLTVSKGTSTFALARFARAMASPDKSCVVPLADLAVHWDSERSARMFRLIREDKTDEIGKSLCTDSGLAG
ncbi:LCP family protein [Nocardioides jejuensis]|uniref:LytR family transcriptional regulator n=1 Tax=Nocardioides jejuensis TaxID=2502782 RepID=A0A4R1BWQ6_9ACTN|nr:LCP family protein [Nocardioides jejuensis]TCJ22449.1 LytR family transcriptional regulator [Nocardioides jejuensis]